MVEQYYRQISQKPKKIAEILRKIESIFQWLDNHEISVSEFERKSGLSNTYLKKTLERGADITQKIADRIRENNPKEYFKIFPEEEVNSIIVSEPETFIERRRAQKTTTQPYMVPFIPVKAQAGYVKANDQEIFVDTLEKYALPPMVNPHGAVWRYWEIQGDSMEPVFREGDIILTSQVHQMDWQNLRNFYTYVIVTRNDDGEPGRILIKRIFCKNDLEWVLISENEDKYPQQLLPVEYVKEVWIYRKTWKTDASPTKTFEIKV